MSLKLIVQAGSYMSATLSVMIANYAFHILAARNLISFDYGVLAGLFAFFGLVAFASTGIQNKMTEVLGKTDFASTQLKPILNLWLKRFSIVGITLFCIIFILSPWIKLWFHTSLEVIIAFSFVFFITPVLSCTRGFLQGQLQYEKLSFNFFLESSLKLLLTMALISWNPTLLGIILVLTLSQIPSMLLGLKQVYQWQPVQTQTQNTPPSLVPFWCMMLYFGFFASWFNIDMLFVQNLYPEQAGSYSIASKLGQIILFGGSNVVNFMFPFMIQSKNNQKYFQLIFGAFLLILLGTIVGMATLYFGQRFFVTQLFGAEYIQAQSWLIPITIYAGIISLIHLGVQSAFARGQYKFFTGFTILNILWGGTFYFLLNKSFIWLWPVLIIGALGILFYLLSYFGLKKVCSLKASF